MTYKPQPGTIPYRVINFLRLQPAGKEFTSAQLSEELDILGPTISSSLDYPRKMGLVQCHKGGNGLLYWSIGTGQAEPLPADYEPDLPLHELPPVRMRPSRAKGAVEVAPAAETHSDEKVAAASIEVKEAPAVTFRVGEFSDGVLVLERGKYDRFEISADEAKVLMDFLFYRAAV